MRSLFCAIGFMLDFILTFGALALVINHYWRLILGTEENVRIRQINNIEIHRILNPFVPSDIIYQCRYGGKVLEQFVSDKKPLFACPGSLRAAIKWAESTLDFVTRRNV